MAQAVEQNTPKEWDLDDYVDDLMATSGCKRHEALNEMRERLVHGRATLIRQRLVDDKPYNPWDHKPYNKEAINPDDFERSYNIDINFRGKVQVSGGTFHDKFTYRYTVAELPWITASEPAPAQQLEDKTGPDPFKTGASHASAALPASGSPKQDTKTWITDEAIRLKKAGKIPADARRYISHFAQLLAKSMEKAAETDKSIHPVGWRHIKNMLSDWNLWPVESIKTS